MKNNHQINVSKAMAHTALAECGAANGIGNRARSQPSKKEKARCPRRQRRTWRPDSE